jgi:hypothetical protein
MNLFNCVGYIFRPVQHGEVGLCVGNELERIRKNANEAYFKVG